MQQVAVKMVEENEGRENRESGLTLAQVGTKNNDAAGVVVACHNQTAGGAE
jgi:hypothetical protein